MNPRVAGGHAARLLAALLPATCMQTVVLDHPLADAGHGDADASTSSDANDIDVGAGGDGSGDHGLRCIGGGSLSPIDVAQSLPTIIIALDRATSMSAHLGPTGSSGTRFSVARDAINDVLDNYGSVVQFGYVEFPGVNNCANGNAECCASDVIPLVRPRGVLSGIRMQLRQCTSQPNQVGCVNTPERPITQAITRIGNSSLPKSGTTLYTLLLTDGEPTCQSGPFPSDPPCTQATNAISDAFQTNNTSTPLPISTFVVGIGETIAAQPSVSSCLDTLALAGQVPRSDPLNPFPLYYPATTDVLVRSYLDSIVSGTVCRIDINTQNFDPDRIEVDLNGMIPRDPTNQNGWNFDPMSKRRILIYGPACTGMGGFIDNLANSSRPLVVRSCSNLH